MEEPISPPSMDLTMQECKDFLHKSWFSTFSRDRLEYYAFGNTKATDFLYNLDLGQELDVLLLGAGDIRSILRTVHGLENPEHSKRPVTTLRFVLNDIDPDILARDLLLLEIIASLDPPRAGERGGERERELERELEEDLEFLWAVWYNLELSPAHFRRLTTLIERLSEGTFGTKKIWGFFDDATRKAVQKSLQQWEKCRVSPQEAKASRMAAIREKLPDPAIQGESLGQQREEDAVINIFCENIAHHMTRYMYEGGFKDISMVDEYYRTGSADPHYGKPGKQWPSDRRDWHTNPTLMKAHSREYLADVTTSPFMAFIPIERAEVQKYWSLSEACFGILREQVKTLRKLITGGKFNLQVDFLIGDAAATLASDALADRKFDFIDTSNLPDHLSLVALLLLCQPYLRGSRSVLRMESLLWTPIYGSIQEYLDVKLLHLDPLMFPTVFGLRLAESFEFGACDIPTRMEMIAGSHFRYRERLLWVKATRENTTPLLLEENSEIGYFLQRFTRECFAHLAIDHGRNMFVLFKLLQHLQTKVKGGMRTLLDFVEPLLPPDSPFLFQWEVILAVYGYTQQPDSVILLRAPVKSVRVVVKFAEHAVCVLHLQNGQAQIFIHALFTSTWAEVLVLKSQWKKLQKTLMITFPGTAILNLEVGQLTVAHQTDTLEAEAEADAGRQGKEEPAAKGGVTVREGGTVREGVTVWEGVTEYVVSMRHGQQVGSCRIQTPTKVKVVVGQGHADIHVLVSCAVESTSVRQKDGVAQIVLRKQKRSVVGEQILPLCKINFSRLGNKDDLAMHEWLAIDRAMTAHLFALGRDRAMYEELHKYPEKAPGYVGEQILVEFRTIIHHLYSIEEEKCSIGPTCIELGKKKFYDDSVIREVQYVEDVPSLDATQRAMLLVNMKILQYFSKGASGLLLDVLHRNSLQVDQSTAAKGFIRSFVRIHYRRGYIPRQNIERALMLKMQTAPTSIPSCAKCGKRENLKSCVKCKREAYCGRECQKADFKRHKVPCKEAAEQMPALALCTHCKVKPVDPQHVCSRCKKVQYCSMPCRYADWRRHQDHCQEPASEGTKDVEASKQEAQEDRTDQKQNAVKIKASTTTTANATKPTPDNPSSTGQLAPSTKANTTTTTDSTVTHATKPGPGQATSPGQASSPSSYPPCTFCHVPIPASPRVCSKCQEAVYCGPRCEQADWPRHHERCLQLSLGNLASCAGCHTSMTRCPRCQKLWFCSGCQHRFKDHQCEARM